jgi:hypothetical protein
MVGIFRRTPPERLFAVRNRYLEILIEGDALVDSIQPLSTPHDAVNVLESSSSAYILLPSADLSKGVPSPRSAIIEQDVASVSDEEAVEVPTPSRPAVGPVDISGIDFDTFSELTDQYSSSEEDEFSPEKEPYEEYPIPSVTVSQPLPPQEPVLSEISDAFIESEEEAEQTPRVPLLRRSKGKGKIKRIAIPASRDEQPAKRPRRAKVAALDPIDEELTPTMMTDDSPSNRLTCPKYEKQYKVRRYFEAHVTDCQGSIQNQSAS